MKDSHPASEFACMRLIFLGCCVCSFDQGSQFPLIDGFRCVITVRFRIIGMESRHGLWRYYCCFGGN